MKHLLTSLLTLTTLLLFACDESEGKETAHHEPQTEVPGQRTHDTPESTTTNNELTTEQYVAAGPCESWNFSQYKAFRDYQSAGITLSIDCDGLKRATAGYQPALAQYKNKYIPTALDGLANEYNKVMNLAKRPEKITISDYAKRAFDSEEWVLPASSEDKRIAYFVDREATLQPIEHELFADQIYLTVGTDGDIATADIVFGEWQKSELPQAVDKLKQLKNVLLAHKDKIRIVSLPLSTNQTASVFNLEYNSLAKVLQLPFELNADALNHFVENIVPAKNKLQSTVGQVTMSLNFYSILSQHEISSLINNGAAVKPQVFTKYLQLIEQLQIAGPELGQVVSKFNVRLIRFAKASHASFRTYHSLGDGILNIFVVEESIISLDFVDVDRLQECLTTVQSNNGDFSTMECRAQFR